VKSTSRALVAGVGAVAALAFAGGVSVGDHGPVHPARHAARVVGGSAEWPHLVWQDDFSGPAGAGPNPQLWSFDTGGGWGDGELESYTSTPANAELDGRGQLVITAQAESHPGPGHARRSYTSARLQTLHKFEFQYGLVEARINVPAGQGLVAQFWALGSEAYERENWPACGEIDTMEVRGSQPNVLHGTIHGPWPSIGNEKAGSLRRSTSFAAGFHVYAVEWEPHKISFLLDGSVYETITRAELPRGAAWPFQHPFFLLLDLAVGGEWAGSPSPDTPFPARMTVDWVRVWQR
jgi:beta-glucanase (GH16 family)